MKKWFLVYLLLGLVLYVVMLVKERMSIREILKVKYEVIRFGIMFLIIWPFYKTGELIVEIRMLKNKGRVKDVGNIG